MSVYAQHWIKCTTNFKHFSNLLKLCNVNSKIEWNVSNQIHTTPALTTFWEREKKSGYKTALTLPSRKQLILDGLKELRAELVLFKNEVVERFQSDPILAYRPG